MTHATRITRIPGARTRRDDDGTPVVELATCGVCGRTWNDAAISSVTPVPSGRCPFEHLHADDEPGQPRYVVQGRYTRRHGWEDLVVEDNRNDARLRLKEYNDNEPQYPHRIVRRWGDA